MEDEIINGTDLVHMARLALAGSEKDIQLYIRRIGRKYRKQAGETSKSLQQLLREAPTRNSPLRKAEFPNVPVDGDSRLQLVRLEYSPEIENEPIFNEGIYTKLSGILDERRNIQALDSAGIPPTRSALFAGPPGVGKTLAARWLARELKLPLLVLDLSAVMSSFLGKTGANVRNVFDYARGIPCVLLLDEFDAIAKRRDDFIEVGELKRLVTVLLQEIETWGDNGLLIAATNHPKLLDPAVWRRFDLIVEFGNPNFNQRKDYLSALLTDYNDTYTNEVIMALAALYEDKSYSEILREVRQHLRNLIVHGKDVSGDMSEIVKNQIGQLSQKERIEVAVMLSKSRSLSQREINRITGVSRDTIRRALG